MIPLSVSIKPHPGRTVRELRIDIRIKLPVDDDNGRTVMIKDVFPHNDQETRDYESHFSLKVSSGAKGILRPTLEGTSIRVLYTIQSGFGST